MWDVDCLSADKNHLEKNNPDISDEDNIEKL